MALPLITFTKDIEDNPGSTWSAKLIEATVTSLSANFSAIPCFYPLIVIGTARKNSLLEALLKNAPSVGEERANRSFECEENAADGMYVWPWPVRLNQVTLMLLKVRTPRDRHALYLELRRKVVAGMALLSSVCCLCEERSQVSDNIDAFAEDYNLISEKLPLKISKLLVCIEDSWLTNPEFAERFNEQRRRYAEFLDTHSWKSEMIRLFDNDQFHSAFARSHNHLFNPRQPYMDNFLKWTRNFVNMSALKLHFSAYISKMPDITDNEADHKINALRKDIARAKAVINGGISEFVKKITTNERSRYVLDSNVVQTILKNYEKVEKLIVLVFMGAPGLGKSTLLNNILQYVFELPQPPSTFTVGETTEHTTIGSQVILHPLHYKSHQIMLIDLEGLGGTETSDQDLKILQENLKSALLTVASVPCILVNNTNESLRFAQNIIEKIVGLNKDFHFQTERIHLIFCDKDSTHAQNEDFVALVQQTNRKHFSGLEVVQLIHKPNFVSASAQQKGSFLQALMDDSRFPKKWSLGSSVNLQVLLTKVRVIATNETTDLRRVQLTKEEQRKYTEFIKQQKSKIQTIRDKTRSLDKHHLLMYFDYAIERELRLDLEEVMNCMSLPMRNNFSVQIELELNVVRTQMIDMELTYNFIRVLPSEKMVEFIEGIVKFYYNTSDFDEFCRQVDDFSNKLRQIKQHFPESSIDTLLNTVSSNKDWYAGFHKAVIAGTIIGTVLTLGGGATFLVARTAAAGGAALITEEIVVCGLLSGICSSGLSVIPYAVGYKACEVICSRRAVELLWIDSLWGNGQVNSKVFDPSLQLNAPASVLLFIGPKATLISQFANTLIRFIAPFTPANFDAFNPKKYTQVMFFDYPHPENKEMKARSYLICLVVDENPNSKPYRAVMKIAEKLIPAASVACLFMDNPIYAQTLLSTLYPPPVEPISEQIKTKTRIVLLPKCGVNIREIQRTLMRCEVEYRLKPIEHFWQQRETFSIIGEIKSYWDSSEDQEYRFLKEQVDSLPKIVSSILSA